MHTCRQSRWLTYQRAIRSGSTATISAKVIPRCTKVDEPRWLSARRRLDQNEILELSVPRSAESADCQP